MTTLARKMFVLMLAFTFIFGIVSTSISSEINASQDDEIKMTSKKIEISDEENDLIILELEKGEKNLKFKVKKDKSKEEKSKKEESASKNDNLINISEVENKLINDNSLIQLQIFNTQTDEQVLVKTVESLEDLNGIKLKPSKEIKEKNKKEPFYSIDYTMILSTSDYTGFYEFTQFYINKKNEIHPDQLTHMLEYNKEESLLGELDFNLFKNKNETTQLKKSKKGDVVSALCLICGVGDIYRVKSTVYYNDWVRLAELNAIKGVTSKFTLSTSSGVKFETKFAASGLGVESSGSVSNSLDIKTTWGPLTGSSKSSPGRALETEYKFSKKVYEKISGNNGGPDEYTRVGVYDHIGGAKYGSYLYSNGKDINSVSGPTFYPPSSMEQHQTKSNTFTAQAGTSVYGYSISLSATSSSSTSNIWSMSFASGNYDYYKVYNLGSRNNVTAKF
ncbi:hypothetical protein [Chengkuizengella marina]|uniref:Uncharacterized protein n=1 Tax=Chengkuizengella marina TaxID=2507566 RepID=A0A6N9Q048_9BACL|nr:hypothetical protein [Chengkuizengella marina]NBI28245.1 hypothetical protein [Chengkuizengella marina]